MATNGRRCEIAQLFFANQVNSIYREALQTVEIERPCIVSFTNWLGYPNDPIQSETDTSRQAEYTQLVPKEI